MRALSAPRPAFQRPPPFPAPPRTFPTNRDLSVAEAVELGRRSIYHATFRDCASGGTVSVYHVTQDGWTKVHGDDVTELHNQLYPSIEKHPAACTPVI